MSLGEGPADEYILKLERQWQRRFHCSQVGIVDIGFVRELLIDDGNELLFSAASSWEIALKYAQGKLALPDPPSRYVPSRLQSSGVTPIAVQHAHALRVAELPVHHRDPFDRLLVAQSQLERAPLLTVDDKLRAYDVELVWAK